VQEKQNGNNEINRKTFLRQGGSIALITALGLPLYSCDTTSAVDALSSTTDSNIKAFGAKGDGVSDDTQAFLDAFSAARSANGGAIYMPDGEYVIKSRLSVDFPNFRMEGESKDGVILKGLTFNEYFRFSGSNDISNLLFKNFTVEHGDRRVFVMPRDFINKTSDIHFDSIKMTAGVDGTTPMDFNSPDSSHNRWFFRNCFIQNEGDSLHGIHVRTNVDGIWIEGNEVNLTNANNSLGNDDGAFNNIAVYADCRNIHINNNVCRGGGHSPIALSPSGKASIIGNKVYDCLTTSEGGIEVEWKDDHGGGLTSQEVIISSNYVENCYWGIFVVRRDLAKPNPFNVIIANNIIRGCEQAGVFMNAAENVIVGGNIIDNCATCVRIEERVIDVIISSNHMINSSRGVWFRNIEESFGTDISIIDNLIKGMSTVGILPEGSAFCKLDNNQIVNISGHGINGTGDAISSSTISGNTLRNIDGKGIWLGGSATNNLITGNLISSTGSEIDDGGTGNILENNKFL